jgi:hypothetical protein
MRRLFESCQDAIVLFDHLPSGQTSRKAGTQSVESRISGIVALPGTAVIRGTPVWMGEPKHETGDLP